MDLGFLQIGKSVSSSTTTIPFVVYNVSTGKFNTVSDIRIYFTFNITAKDLGTSIEITAEATSWWNYPNQSGTHNASGPNVSI